MKLGEIICYGDSIPCNEGRATKNIEVLNTGDRPVQIGSHYHFFEINRELEFDREEGYGFRLNIPAGTAVRFEPYEKKSVELVELAGKHEVYGLNSLVNGKIEEKRIRK